jgi:hypothetical protein
MSRSVNLSLLQSSSIISLNVGRYLKIQSSETLLQSRDEVILDVSFLSVVHF